ncbi:MAG TPA: carboxypeptidase-like regulatory domain-containing protein [Thermoanaerobaculia bacterium]|nr:carboxypeptidase-like regulatory domain-containing protein [Thermoanaerobaculia bacterium]
MAWQTFGHRASIAGRVTDAQTGKPLPGVRVEIASGPEVLTAGDGFYRFLDLPAGTYTLTASLPGSGSRYGTKSAPVTLGEELEIVDLELPATTVKGKVKDQGGQAVKMAEVRVQGSGESTWSDAQGNYALSGVEAGARRIAVSARGFQKVSETVAIGQPGAIVTRDVTLSP